MGNISSMRISIQDLERDVKYENSKEELIKAVLFTEPWPLQPTYFNLCTHLQFHIAREFILKILPFQILQIICCDIWSVVHWSKTKNLITQNMDKNLYVWIRKQLNRLCVWHLSCFATFCHWLPDQRTSCLYLYLYLFCICIYICSVFVCLNKETAE